MKKLDFIKHPECFHGEKFLSNSSNYFEGWYFKISNGTDVISFIPGINTPFFIKIGDNFFSLDEFYFY